MLIWSDNERDAFAEFLNMGMGLAAASLSSMLDQEVLLSVPKVELVPRDRVAEKFGERVGDEIVGVRQTFDGSVSGDIALLFAKSGSFALVRELVADDIPLEDLPDIEQEAITEVGNIVLNGCMAAIANSPNLEIPTGLPSFVKGIPFDLQSTGLAGEDEPCFLLGQSRFDLKNQGISGCVVLFIPLPSAMRFKQEIERLLSSYAATG